MFTRIEEEHQLHGFLTSHPSERRILIVLALELIHHCAQFLQVTDLIVMPWLHVTTLLEITKDDSLLRKDLIASETKLHHLVLQDIDQVHTVFGVDQTIMEHPHVLVEPQFNDQEWVVTVLSRGRAEPLEDLVDITEVEGVVRLLRSGQ